MAATVSDTADQRRQVQMSPEPMQQQVFLADLTALIPQMRAFSRSLCRNSADADDLAQDALLKAWNAREKFEPGTNLKAWVFTIIRNQFYSDRRRAWRKAPYNEEVAERTLVAISSPDATLELDDARRALAMLSDEQREALILIGVAGLSYDEVARICDCADGTIKSRVSRARARLLQIMSNGWIDQDGVAPHESMGLLTADAERLGNKAA